MQRWRIPYRRLIGVSSESAEASLQRPVVGKLSATAGLGYAYYGGPQPSGYAIGASGPLTTSRR